MNMAEENEQEMSQEEVAQDQAQSQENENVLVEEQAAQAETQQDFSNEEKASQIDHIMSMAEKDPSIKELPEYQAMIAEMEAKDAESKTQAESNENENENEVEEENESNEEAQEEEFEEEDEFENLTDEDDVFGLKSSKKKTKYKFENEKDVVKLIQKKGFKEVPTFFESVDKWRNDSQKYVELSERTQQIEDGLSSLPKPIKDAIFAYSGGQDWRGAFSESSLTLDFSSEFEDLNKEDVVKYYYKDKYEKIKSKYDEDIYDEEEFEDRINDFYDSSKRLFTSDKTAMETKRAEIIDKQNQEAESLKSSALSSVKSLKTAFPNFKSSQLQKVRQALVNGNLDELFKSEGKYIDDAAEMLAYALYGKQILKTRMEKAEAKGKNASKEEYFQRGNKTPRTKTSQQGYSNQKANKAVSHLQGQFKDDPYA